jgi:hypothetical protein
MNSSIYSADRATHLRILLVAMVGCLAIIGTVLSTRGAIDNASKIVTTSRPHDAGIVIRESRLRLQNWM